METQRILIAKTTNLKGETVSVSGWVDSRRDHGKIIFIDVRDISGKLQVIFTPENKETYEIAQKLRPEWVISVSGKIKERPGAMANEKLETGKVEMEAEKLIIFSEAKTLPFSISGDGYDINEEKRLKYRYLDLRRKRLKNNLIIRQKTILFIRKMLADEGFIEVDTPILTKSTPEGARDFLVPARMEKGKFYALPQSPQQYKQLLQVAGIEKYFQIAKCFRDEDQRADRQAEFTQLDIEMSFASQKEILALIEKIYSELVKNIFPNKRIMEFPFPVISYKEAMDKYGTDRPDVRKDKNDDNELAFLFVVDFPMFEWHEKEKKWGAMHHPFTRPQTEDLEKIKKEPEKILAYQYDLVLNGQEIAGGSLRTYKPEILEAVFEVLGHSKEEVRNKFGHLIEAFSYGVPPHGGIASGLDRFFQVVLGEPNIREVIAFPKTGDNRDPMMESPSSVSKEQLKELGIKIEKNGKQ